MATLDLKSFNVLLVDPDRFYRAIVREMLRTLRCWNIQEAADFRAARPFLTQELDILITEWAGTEIRGGNVIRQIRNGETDVDPMIPIVTIMADTSKRKVLLARDAGANELLAKPLLMRRLYERLMHATLAPQPFVQAAHYVGPDRRRFIATEYHGPNRRARQRAKRSEVEGGPVGPASQREWPTGAPFVPPTDKLVEIRMRADRPGVSIAEAVAKFHRALKDLEHFHASRLSAAIKRLKRSVTDEEISGDPEVLGRELRSPALDIATLAPVFNFTLAGDLAWMLKTLVEILPLAEAPVLMMCRRLVETLRVTIDACVYDSSSTEGERILKELQTTNRRLLKRYVPQAASPAANDVPTPAPDAPHAPPADETPTPAPDAPHAPPADEAPTPAPDAPHAPPADEAPTPAPDAPHAPPADEAPASAPADEAAPRPLPAAADTQSALTQTSP